MAGSTTPDSTSPFKDDCLQGTIALVTGGGSGIGYEITRQLLLHGCAGAVICGRRAKFLQKSSTMLSQETGKTVVFQVCDVRQPEQCRQAVEVCMQQFQRIDILVNGAAGNFLAQAKDLSPKGFATVMAIDALGTFNMCHAAHHSMLRGGVVVNISATLQYGATWWQSHASAAKSAVDSLTRSLALEWGSSGIRVVGVAPGPIADTPGTTKLAPDADTVEDLIDEGIPLGRLGRTFEIGHAVVYLCSAQYVTGDVLVVDGGQWLYRPPMVPREMVEELSRGIEQKSRAQAPQARL